MVLVNFLKFFSLKDLKPIGATTNEKNNIIPITDETIKKSIWLIILYLITAYFSKISVTNKLILVINNTSNKIKIFIRNENFS